MLKADDIEVGQRWRSRNLRWVCLTILAVAADTVESTNGWIGKDELLTQWELCDVKA